MAPSWPYQFVSLSPAETQHRRELLDYRGYYAQCSAIAAILIVRAYRSCTRATKNPSGGRYKRPLALRHDPRSWWDHPPFRGWRESRREYIVAVSWLGWLLILSVWGTGNDYLHLTKSLGHIAISQLPFQVLISPATGLTSRPSVPSPSPSIVSRLISTPQQKLTPYHRLLGRLVLAPLLTAHAILYLSFFQQSNSGHPAFGSLLAKRIRDADVQWGLTGVCLVGVIVMLFTTRAVRSCIRISSSSSGGGSGSVATARWMFFVGHVVLVGAFCVAVYSHVGYARVYVLEGLGVFVLNLGSCLLG